MTTAAPSQTTISNKQRKAIIFMRCQDLMRRVPATWKSWDAEQASAFNQDCRDLQRHAITGSLWKMMQAAERVAKAYGVSMATIDPCHGVAA